MTVASASLAYLQKEGLGRFARRVFQELAHRAKRARSFSRRYIAGRWVELRGDEWELDGMMFSLSSPGIATHYKNRFVSGGHEDKERRLVVKHVRRDLPVIEGGGCVGVVSCVTNRLLKDPTRHIVVEANPKLWDVLKKNRDRNGCKFDVVEAAFDENGPQVTFHIHKLFVGGSVQRETDEKVTVPAVTLRGLLQKTGWNAVTFVLDIEGGEIDLMEKEMDVLRDHVKVFIVEMHPAISGDRAIADAMSMLERAGFTFVDRETDVYVFTKE